MKSKQRIGLAKLTTLSAFFTMAATMAFAPVPALADDWKDESGHRRGKHGHGKFKEEYWDGHCKVKRKLDKNGEYEEERKCKGYAPHSHGHTEVYVPGPAIMVDPAIRVHGTVTIRP